MSIRKPKCLTLHEKSLVIQGLNEGQCATYLAKQYGVAKSTICKIKQNKELICEAVKDTYMGLAKRQTLKTSVFPRMEKKLYEWFLEQRNQNVILNGDMIKQTAKQIHLQIKENDKQFTASDGWLERFKKRFGIRLSKRHSKVENIKNPMTKSPELQHTLIAPEVDMKSNVAVWNECCGIEVNVKVEDMEDCQNSEMKLIKEHLETSTPFIPIDRVIESLNVVNQWAEQSNINININDVVVIKKLLDKAIIQKIKNSRKQTKIPDYFNTK